MRDAASQAGSGPDIRGLIQTYGPMAAAAAGILLARGRGGQQVIDMLRRIAPKHAEKLHRSPVPYIVDKTPPGGSLVSDAHPMQSHFLGIDALKPGQPSRFTYDIDKTLGAIAKEAGVKDPRHLGYLHVNEGQRELGASLHEFGHAVGFDRGRELLRPEAHAGAIRAIGPTHLDQVRNPKVYDMVRDSLAKSPALEDYYAHYLKSKVGRNEPIYKAWGELVNEAWAQRLQRRAGLTPHDIVDDMRATGWTDELLSGARSKFPHYLMTAKRSGRLPARDEFDAFSALDEMLRVWGRPQAPPVSAPPSLVRSLGGGPQRPAAGPSTPPPSPPR